MSDITMKEGQFIMTSNGEYSDYSVGFMFEVLQDIHINTIMPMLFTLSDKYSLEYNDDKTVNNYGSATGDHDGVMGAFHELLIEHEYIKKVEYTELHTGSYGGLKFEQY